MISEINAEELCYDYRLVEGYAEAIADQTCIWHLHHRLEDQGYARQTLIDKDLYKHRPPDEMIFLKPKDHSSRHHSNKGQHWYNNGVESIMAEKCPVGFQPGRLYPSDESRKKMSAAHKGQSPANKGVPCSAEQKKKIRDKIKGKKMWNNGIDNMYSIECPGEGWGPGFLPKKKKS